MKLAAAVLSLLLLPTTLFAWGGDGHQIVALIAEDRLTSQAKAGIHELLGENVNISDAEIASWADQIRRERRATGPWHYVDIPTDATKFDKERDGNHGNNVIDKINEFEKVLADKNKSQADRAEALKFIVHLVGDVHQPLHCAERNKDKGGNGRLVFFLDRKKAVKLHECWDSLILLNRKGRTRVLDYAESLNKKITAKQQAEWGKGTPTDWANESHRVAVEHTYKGVPADGPPPKLDEAYVDSNGPVIDEQLEKGGVRLALILNRVFAK